MTPSDANSDANGNAIGGVRTPYLDVPTGSFWVRANGCGLAGSKSPMSAERLSELYPNHGTYMNRVVRRTQQLVKERWLLREAAKTICQEAAHSAVPFEAPVP